MLKKMPKEGEVVRRVGKSNQYVTHGELYIIDFILQDGEAEFIDDTGHLEFIGTGDFKDYELCEEEES